MIKIRLPLYLPKHIILYYASIIRMCARHILNRKKIIALASATGEKSSHPNCRRLPVPNPNKAMPFLGRGGAEGTDEGQFHQHSDYAPPGKKFFNES